MLHSYNFPLVVKVGGLKNLSVKGVNASVVNRVDISYPKTSMNYFYQWISSNQT